MRHGEIRAASSEAEIGTLREHVLALLDADCLLPEDGAALLAALGAALRDLAAGDLRAARTGLQRFVERAQRLMAAGALDRRAGHLLLEMARTLLAGLCG